MPASSAASLKNAPVMKASTNATSKMAASHASGSGKEKPAEAMYWAVPDISMNLKTAAIAKTAAKMSLATRTATVLLMRLLRLQFGWATGGARGWRDSRRHS